MAIKGATFDLQTVLAKYDGAMYNALSNNHDGYVSWTGSGNPITFTDTNVLTLKNGYILVHGRLIVVDGATDITLNPGSSISSGDGRLVLQIDTSRTNTQTVLNQVEILQEYKATSSSWRALSTDDINALSTGVYEVQLCHFTVANGTSSGVQIDISTDTIVGNLQADIETLADNLENAFPVSIANGGTSGTTKISAQQNLGISYDATELTSGTVAAYADALGNREHKVVLGMSGQSVTDLPNNATCTIEIYKFDANSVLCRATMLDGTEFIRTKRNGTWGSWVKDAHSVVPIADGGTGGTSRLTAQRNLMLPETNNITLIEGTSSQIGAMGFSVCYYNKAQYTGSHPEVLPTNWGVLVSFCNTYNDEWSQLWLAQGGGNMYRRSGNSASTPYAVTWTKMQDAVPDVMKITLHATSLAAASYTRLSITASEVVSGNSFCTATTGNTYITNLPTGIYRVTLQAMFPASDGTTLLIGMNGASSSSQPNFTLPIQNQKGTSMVNRFNCSGILKKADGDGGNLGIYAYSSAALSGEVTAFVTIERLG